MIALGVIGDDGEGFELLKGLDATGVDVDALVIRADRFTPTYTKPMLRERGRHGARAEPAGHQEPRARCRGEVGGQAHRGAARPAAARPRRDRRRSGAGANCGVITERVREELVRPGAGLPHGSLSSWIRGSASACSRT